MLPAASGTRSSTSSTSKPLSAPWPRDEHTEILFDVYRMSPEQAMATVRRGRRVLTLHAFPEEEAQDRILRT
jgi:hypothetical protein